MLRESSRTNNAGFIRSAFSSFYPCEIIVIELSAASSTVLSAVHLYHSI